MTTEERLNKLERENRWMRRVGSLLLAGIGVVLLVAQAGNPSPPDLVVNSLAVADKAGHHLIELTHNGKGGTGIRILDARGEPRTALVSTQHGSGVVLCNSKGRAVASLAVSTQDSPGLQLAMPDGRGVWLGVTKEGVTKLDFSDGPKHHRIVLATVPGKDSLLCLGDCSHKTRVILGVDKNGVPSLTLIDKNQIPRAVIGSTATKNPSTGATTTTSEGTVTLYDAKGGLIWQEPR